MQGSWVISKNLTRICREAGFFHKTWHELAGKLGSCKRKLGSCKNQGAYKFLGLCRSARYSISLLIRGAQVSGPADLFQVRAKCGFEAIFDEVFCLAARARSRKDGFPTVGAVCDRPYFVDYKKDARSQTAPTVDSANSADFCHGLLGFNPVSPPISGIRSQDSITR